MTESTRRKSKDDEGKEVVELISANKVLGETIEENFPVCNTLDGFQVAESFIGLIINSRHLHRKKFGANKHDVIYFAS